MVSSEDEAWCLVTEKHFFFDEFFERAMNYLLPNQSLFLFSKFIDHSLLSKWIEECKEFFEFTYGGRTILQYSKEIEFFATLAYYLPTIILYDQTPGQSYLELKQFRLSSKGVGVLPCGIKDRLLTAFLYCLLPYLYSQKYHIWSTISEAWNVLMGPNDTTNINPGGSTENKEQNSSYLGMISGAIVRSVKSISNETEVRLERIISFIYELHLCSFFFTGRYSSLSFLFLSFDLLPLSRFLELPLRFSNKLLLTSRPSIFQGKMKALGWLLSFRLSLLVYYAARVLMAELDREMETQPSPSPQPKPNEASTTTPTITHETENTSIEGSNFFKQCPLCLDAMKEAAVVPCGHVACWHCLHSYAIQSNRNNTNHDPISLTSTMIKCPVCRVEFLPQKIRPIFL
jgi:hypothetical protein